MRSTLLQARRESGGFSLMEVIVALLILSTATVALVELFSSSLKAVKKSEDYSRALVHARSLLEEAYSSPGVEGLEGFHEFDDGMGAETSVALVSTLEGGESAADAALMVYLYEIRVKVSWPPSGSLELAGTKAVYEDIE